MKRCWGLTRNLKRCERVGDWHLFCAEHSRQPIVFVTFFVFTIVAGMASIYSAFGPSHFKPEREATPGTILFSDKDSPSDEKELLVPKEFTHMDIIFFGEDGSPLQPKRIYHRRGIDFLLYNGSKEPRFSLYVDNIRFNQKPTLSPPSHGTDLARVEYLRYAQDIEPGILFVGVSGAAGQLLDLSLYARTKNGHVDLFSTFGSSVSNNYSIFEDIDGDGISELVTVTQPCTLRMYSLNAKGSEPGYFQTSHSSEEVIKLLDGAIIGSELATAYRKWAEIGCPSTTEGGGLFWDEVQQSVDKHRADQAQLTDIAAHSHRKSNYIVFMDENVPAHLLRSQR